MSQLTHARVVEAMKKLYLGHVAERLDAVLANAARTEPTYLDFLDGLLRDELDSKQRKRVAMGIQIAHFPTVKTLDDFDFKFQPSVDQKLVRELATGRFVANAENVLLFGAPGVGKTHLAIGLGRAVVESGHSALFVSATALLATLAKAEAEGQLADKLTFFSKPKLLVVDELGYLPRGLLWRDDALGEYRRWRAQYLRPLTELEASFADASLLADTRIGAEPRGCH